MPYKWLSLYENRLKLLEIFFDQHNQKLAGHTRYELILASVLRMFRAVSVVKKMTAGFVHFVCTFYSVGRKLLLRKMNDGASARGW